MLYLLANVECGPGVWLGILVFESFAVLLNFGACYIVTPFLLHHLCMQAV